MRKQFYNFLVFTFVCTLCTNISFAQKTDTGWSFEAGINAIDLYPVGEDMPQGEYFDEFFNVNDHWNSGYFLGITKGFSNNVSLTLKGTVNEISKWGQNGNDDSILVDNLKYYGLDAMFNYSFGKGKLQPYLAIGGGYTWIEEGPFIPSTSGGIHKNFTGGATANGSLGLKYMFNDVLGLNLQTIYKHSFDDNLPKHWSHNFGFVYQPKKSENSTEETKQTSTLVDSGWSFEAGINAINVYSVGEDMPQGELFEEFFNVNDHWNSGYYIGVTKSLTDHLSLTAKGTVNEITKWGENGNDDSILVDNLKYYGIDAMVNYSFGKGKLQPFLAVGGGYTWIEEGPYNTPINNIGGVHDFSGSTTANGSAGIKYWINDKIGVDLNTTYKHSFEDNLPTHWSHNLGLVYKISKHKKEQEEASEDRDEDGIPNKYDVCPDTFGLAELGGCPDTDGDGIADKDDLCPTIKGTIAFGGCPDSDGDGIPDNRDKCPKVKGTDQGCPINNGETGTGTGTGTDTGATTSTVTAFNSERKIYFDTDSAVLDENAKVILNDIGTSLTSTKSYEISVEGHTDSVGSERYNDNLSLARAQAVKYYLDRKNLTNSTIVITSAKGETQPAATNNTASGRALNRRSELKISITVK